MGFSSGSAPVGAAGVGTTVGVGVAVAFGGETASGSVAGAGSEAIPTDTDCPRPVCVITIKLMPKLTRAMATRVMGMDRSTDVSRLKGPRAVCVITIKLMAKLTKAKATRVMDDRSTDVSRLNGPPPH